MLLASFFKDYFYEGTTSYHGWYGITINENILKVTGITSTLCKKNKVYQVDMNNPSKIIKEWDSQKDACKELGMVNSTLKYRMDNKYIFENSYLIKASDYITK